MADKIAATQGQVDKAASKVAKRALRKYEEGDPREKVWMNFQTTKGLKREFVKQSKANGDNYSDFFRDCMEIYLQLQGSRRSVMEEVRTLVARGRMKRKAGKKV